MKTGIQENEEDDWIPASAGMTDRRRKMSQVDLESTACSRTPRLQGEGSLVILEMAEHGEIRRREVPLSPDIAFRFSVFWSVVAQRRRQPPEVRLPFHHLGSSEMWKPLMEDGKPSPDKKLTTMVRLDPSFFDCLADEQFRDRARRVLIDTKPYFSPEEKTALYTMLKIRPTTTAVRKNEELYRASVQTGRDARFRIDVVVVAYKHTCALTGYRMTTLEMESIVDAAHIHEFRDSRNNDARNGIALSKNAHWEFDRGLWSLDTIVGYS